jgi:hypothetical protein
VKQISFAGGKAQVVHIITYTLQEREVLHAVARAKVKEIETKINAKRLKPGTLAHTRTYHELSIWQSIENKFHPDRDELGS